MASAVFNLYERLDEMKNTLIEVTKSVERDEFVLSLLEKATKEEIEFYQLNIFMDSVKSQINSFKTQKEKLDKMLVDTMDVIDLYEKDKETYEPIITSLLTSFGYPTDEVKEN